MLEQIILEVCQQMSEALNCEQLGMLKNVLYVCFRGKEISEEKNEIVPAEGDEDMRLLQLFKASKMVSGRSDGTLKQYIRELRCCRNSIGKNFRDITTMDLRWYLGMAKEHRKNKTTTLQNKIHYLNSFYSFLLNEGIISNNPVSRVEMPKIEQVVRKTFSAEEIESIRKSCTHVRDRALIEFLLSTGLRVSELASLNISDVDMDRKEFTVTGKGNKERTVYFSASAGFYLKDYLKWRTQAQSASVEQLSSEPLFTGTRKPYNRLSKAGVEYLCRKLGKSAGVENTHPHRFRRTFATNMAARGMKMEELMKLMGHSKMDTTLIYCNVWQENIKSSYGKCA